MRHLQPCLPVLALAAAAAGQGQVARAMPCKDVFDALAERDGPDAGAVAPTKRFLRLVESLIAAGGLQAGRRRVVQLANNDELLVVMGVQEHVDAVQSMLGQLRRAEHPELRVQCTLVTMPAEVAAAHGLEAGKALPVDEAAAGKLLKDAVKQKGTLQNLPETKALPLAPFAAEPADKADEKPGAGARDERLRVRGEGLLVADDEAVLALQLVRGPLPKDRTELPSERLIDQTLRLKAGAGALLTNRSGDQATVLWVRLVAIAPPAPAGRDAAKPVGR